MLLLAIFEQIHTSKVTRNFIEINNELAESYITIANRYSIDIEQSSLIIAFITLAETKFWCLRPKSNAENHKDTAIDSLELLRKYYWGATFSEDLFPLLKMETSRNKLAKVILLGLGQK